MKPWLLLAFVGLLSYPAPVGAAPEHRASGDIWHGVWATQWTETVRDDSGRLVLIFHGWFTMGDTEGPLARRSLGDEGEVCHPAVEVRDDGRVDPCRGEWAARSSSVVAALDCLLQEMVSDAGL
jgi:hypothetical protein